MILQTAYLQWVRNNAGDGHCAKEHWKIHAADGEVLGTLPFSMDEREAMSVLRLARKYELDAFNEGVKEAMRRKENAEKVTQAHNQAAFNTLVRQNEVLADKLQMMIEKGPDHGNSAVN